MIRQGTPPTLAGTCDSSRITSNKFHVYKYLSDAIEEVRRHQQKICSEEDGRLIKSSRWRWLKATRNLKRNHKQTLEQIMEVNKSLQKPCLLKEGFAEFYPCTSREEAEEFMAGWIKRCRQSRLNLFIRLARRLQRRAHGIFSYFEHRITNGVSEGINNKIKVLKRRSYGFHEEEYFFLKILNPTGAFPSLESLRNPQF